MTLTIHLDPQQVPWLLGLLRSSEPLQRDLDNVFADPEFDAHRKIGNIICDTMRTVHDQIIEQLEGDPPCPSH